MRQNTLYNIINDLRTRLNECEKQLAMIPSLSTFQSLNGKDEPSEVHKEWLTANEVGRRLLVKRSGKWVKERMEFLAPTQMRKAQRGTKFEWQYLWPSCEYTLNKMSEQSRRNYRSI